MTSNYSLRPEDFRYAWANAYQSALLDARDLQQQSERQLAAVKDLINLSTQQTEFGRVNLHKTASVIVDMLKRASADSETRIDTATSRLVDHSNWFMERERKLQAESEKLTQHLASELRKLQIEHAELLEKSIWKRLLDIFRPRGTGHA